MRKILIILALVVPGLLVNSCTSNSENQISMSGAFALYPLAVKWKDEYQKIHPEIRIDVQAGGAGKGMADALSGQVTLGMVSRDINEEEIRQGVWFIPVTKDAVIPTMNPKNPNYNVIVSKGIKRGTFVDLWVNEKPLTWGDIAGNEAKDAVKVYVRSDAAGAKESWAKYLGTKQDKLKGTGVFGDPGLASAVKKDVYGIGFNNMIYVYDVTTKKPFDGLRAIPIDLNENGLVDSTENFYDTIESLNAAIADGRYPSPPARELYFVAKGKPQNKVVLDFLHWILTDGQKYVNEAGFIHLSEDKLKEAQEKLGK